MNLITKKLATLNRYQVEHHAEKLYLKLYEDGSGSIHFCGSHEFFGEFKTLRDLNETIDINIDIYLKMTAIFSNEN